MKPMYAGAGAAAKRRWAGLLIILLAFALRVHRLGFQELRGDETFGYFFSQQSFGEIVRATLALREPHPVASYFAEKTWLALAGDSEFALRFLSVWWGVLAVALLYRLGRQLRLGPGVSALAALLLALSPYAVWHSQDARMYTMSLALTLASAWLAFEAIGRGRKRDWLAYIVVAWLALQTHYYAVFVLAAQTFFMLPAARFIWRRPDRLRGWLAAVAAIGLLTFPWLIVARDTLVGYGGNGDSPAFGAMLARSLRAFAVGETAPAAQQLIWAGLAGLLLALGLGHLLLVGSLQRQAAVFLAFYLAVPVLATWASALSRPIFNERYLVAAAPPFYLLLASAVWPALSQPPSTVAQRRFVFATNRVVVIVAIAALLVLEAGALCSLTRHYADPVYSKTVGWRQLAAALEDLTAGLPADEVRITQNFPDPTLWYYYRGPVQHIVLPPKPFDATEAGEEVARLAAAGVRRVILPVQPAAWWDDRGLAPAALTLGYTLVGERQVAGWPVQVYVRPPEVMPAVAAVFTDGLKLVAAAVEPVEARAGGLLAVHLRWQSGPESLPAGEKLTLQVLDTRDTVVAQTDQPFRIPAIATQPASYGILLPEQGLTPGEHRVILALYNPEQPGAPRLRTTDGADFVPLATVRILEP